MSLASSQNRFDQLPVSPFAGLRELIGNTKPGRELIDMSIGEPKHAPPEFVQQIIHENFFDFGKYPPIKGTAVLRKSISDWLKRRFDISSIDPETHILPLCGTREGLFYAGFLSNAPRLSDKKQYVLMPNPFYLCYAAATLAAGLQPYYLPATKKTEHLPDIKSLDPSVLEDCGIYYYCSPSNPQGAIADQDYQKTLLALSRKYGFIIIADECYADIYSHAAPESLLKTSENIYGDYTNILCLHSLSKRSNLAGLRSGFCAGDPDIIAKFEKMRNVAGPQMPLPLQAASAAAWENDEFVEENRLKYCDKFDMADDIFSSWSAYERPQAGFFLWLNMSEFGGGINATKRLWEKAGIRVIPGEFLSQSSNNQNPGKDYIRMALVGDLEQTKQAFLRFKDVFRI